MTNYNRSYSITITFKDGYGDALTLDSPKSTSVYNAFHNYILGKSNVRGFEIIEEDGSACLYLFEAIAKICRTAITQEETEDGKCKDLDVCDLLNGEGA